MFEYYLNHHDVWVVGVGFAPRLVHGCACSSAETHLLMNWAQHFDLWCILWCILCLANITNLCCSAAAHLTAQSLVEGSLAESLSKPADAITASSSGDAASSAAAGVAEEHVRQLAALLLTVDRYGTVERLYVDARVAYLMGVCDEVCGPRSGASAADIITALPRFYTRALPVLQAEAAWCARVLPAQAASLTPALLSAVLQKVDYVPEPACFCVFKPEA